MLTRKNFELSATEPAYMVEQMGAVTQRTLVMVADDDLVTLEHSLAFYRALPNGELTVVPGTSHFFCRRSRPCANLPSSTI